MVRHLGALRRFYEAGAHVALPGARGEEAPAAPAKKDMPTSFCFLERKLVPAPGQAPQHIFVEVCSRGWSKSVFSPISSGVTACLGEWHHLSPRRQALGKIRHFFPHATGSLWMGVDGVYVCARARHAGTSIDAFAGGRSGGVVL